MGKTMVVLLAFFLMGGLIIAGCSNNSGGTGNQTEKIQLALAQRTPDTRLEEAPFPMWLPTRDGQLKPVEVTGYEVYTGDVPLAYSLYQAFILALEQVDGTMEIPSGLELVSVGVDDSTAQDGRERQWLLYFNDALAEMEAAKQEDFLLGVAKTIIEGNPFKNPQPNFSGIRFYAGDQEITVPYTSPY